MSNVIRVKRNLDAVDDTPSTLVVKRAKKGLDTELVDLVFKFHHSTETSFLEDDPKLMIPSIRSSKPKQNATPQQNLNMNRPIALPRFKVVSQNRMRTANGSELKVMDLTKEDDEVMNDVEKLPDAVRAMMEEYTKSNSMDTFGSSTMATDNFVYDVYFLDEQARPENLIYDANGAISIELEEEDALYFDDNNDNDDCVEDDEDSNAEDDYRNEYPDSDDEAGYEMQPDEDEW
ncbi:UNVERIFIED_CONTAM: hypothetical protein HDU68_004943 [Siphonaria sp. JEL0065]|nr:hypothetical protein HDU68_004943 [Siphonaria sp. JEL0065]